MITIDYFEGQKSSRAPDKESLATFERVINGVIRGQDIETIAGYENVLEGIDFDSDLVRFIGTENFSGHLLVWCLVKDGASSFKTKIAEVTLVSGAYQIDYLQEGDPASDMEFAETREPSIDSSEEFLFFTQGSAVRRLTLTSDVVTRAADMTGLTDVNAVWFDAEGGNRVYAVKGKQIWCSNAAAGGDCTSFSNNATNEWLLGGQFPSSFELEATNICIVGNIICAFSPNKIELKQLEEVQESVNGTITSVKKMTHYATVEHEGTESSLRLGIWNQSIIFVDERAKKLKQLIPVKDANGLIEALPIIDDERNFEKLDFSRVSIIYVGKLRRFVITTGDRGEVVLFDPTKGEFTTASWDIVDIAIDNDGEIFFADNTDGILARVTPDSVLQNGDEPWLTMLMQEYKPSEFFRKLKVKRLAFWLEISPDAEVILEQRVDGGEWSPIKLKLDKIQRSEGSFESPYQVFGLTQVGGTRRREAPNTVGVVQGKIRAKAKGTIVQYRLKIRAKHTSKLKYWGIPKANMNSSMKLNTISKAT